MFGFLVGDGSISEYQVRFAEGTDFSLNKKYADLMKQFFGKCSRASSKRKYSNYECYNTLAAELLKEMGFINGAHNKRIPEWVFRASPKIKQAFIEGLSDADGCERYTQKGTWFSTIELCNKQLIEDIKEVWTSIGLSSGKISSRKRPPHIINSNRIIPETSSYQVTISKCKLPPYENILSVENSGEQEVFDIQVKSNFHNFICNGMPVHNTRAPERRVWYIDIGNLPKMKAEQYVRDIMVRHKNRLNYDASSGEIRDDRKFITMLEDFWLPRRSDGQGTKVETLPPGTSFNQIDDIIYFQKKLYQSLNVPVNRLNSDDQFNFQGAAGTATGITRDEVRFGKFIARMRTRFGELFTKLLERQLVLKQVMAIEEFEKVKSYIAFRFSKDSEWLEMKEQQVLAARGQLAMEWSPFIGRFVSNEWVRKTIMKQNDEDIAEQDALMQEERMMPQYQGMLGQPDQGDEEGGEDQGDESIASKGRCDGCPRCYSR